MAAGAEAVHLHPRRADGGESLQAADVAARAAAAADRVLRRLDELGVTAPRLLHGEGQTCWPLITHAGTLGLPTRIGLEDATAGPGGTAVSGNAELTRLAVQVWNAQAPTR